MIRELHTKVLASERFNDRRLIDANGKATPYYRYFAKLVRELQPKYVVELGTGAGRTAAMIMAALPKDGRFITINWPNPPSGDNVGIELRPFFEDPRLTQLLGDTRDQSIVEKVDSGIDLLYIDSGTKHEYALISAEWELYRPKLKDGCVVYLDDIDANDMMRFWDELSYDKIDIQDGRAGMFVFDLNRSWKMTGKNKVAGRLGGSNL